MMELIDRQALIADYRICGVCNNFESCNGYVTMCDSARMRQAINEAPTIEPEVRHGRWIFKKGDNKETVDGWMCTACKAGFNTRVPYFEVFKYCPMCGARMDGGADNG